MSKYTDLEKRLQAIEVEIPKWTGHVSKRIERLEKLVDCLEDCYDAISILDERTKKQEEPKQDEPEIVYGSTVSVRDQKIKKLFDEVLSDFREAIAQSVEGGDEVMVKLALNALDSDFDKVREKLLKILEGERR